ncbi:MAG: NUDIX domain-containing protein [Candidatus Paceibacterota bacterium]|jgi:8-oxo-dGTP pyrophosphatase MutT (NUDIX family)
MFSEKSAGAVIFRKEQGEIFYLLLHYAGSKPGSRGYWDFAKGHLEEGETEEAAARREIEEETGLKDLSFVSGFRQSIDYFFKFKGRTVFKTVAFFLAETRKKEITISDEHIGYQWLPFEEAFKEMKFANAKNTLKQANNYLIKGSILG